MFAAFATGFIVLNMNILIWGGLVMTLAALQTIFSFSLQAQEPVVAVGIIIETALVLTYIVCNAVIDT